MTGCDTKKRGRWWCNGREGGLIHNNQQTVEGKVRVAKGEALSGDWIGREANNFYQDKNYHFYFL
jgi:hypothetical protein